MEGVEEMKYTLICHGNDKRTALVVMSESGSGEMLEGIFDFTHRITK